MGDTTQLLAFMLAARFKKPLPIIAGILAATLVNHGLAGALGAWIIAVVSLEVLRWVLGVSFLAMAAHYATPLVAVLGTTLGMLIADVPAVLVGEKLAAKIPMRAMRAVAAAIFAALGVATLLGAGGRLGF